MVTLKNGDKLRCVCRFQHRGQAYSGAKIRASIGKRGTWGFTEVLKYEQAVGGIVDDTDWTQYEIPVDIPIQNIGTLGVSAGTDYEVEVKLLAIPGPDIFWEGPANDITLEAPVGEAEFQNLTVSYSKS
jgi:hypothetical protein